jgi:hypothetical protein
MAKKLITPVALLSYPHFDEAILPKNGKGKPKFSGSFLFAPGTDISKLVEAVAEAGVEKFGPTAIAKLKSGALKNVIRTDAEAKGYPEGTIFINARSEQQPGMVYLWPDPATGKPALVIPGLAASNYVLTDADKKKIREVFYPGAKVRVSVTAYGYDNESKGVTFGLNHVQLVDGTGPRIDGRKNAEDEFEADASMAPANMADVE